VGCSNFWGSYAAKPDSTGRAHKPFVDIAILGAGDAHLPPFERGEIAIRSAANIKCYWEDPEATKAAVTADGFLRTAITERHDFVECIRNFALHTRQITGHADRKVAVPK